MVRNRQFVSAIKFLWFWIAAILFGPFSLWYMFFSKKKRRHQAPNYFISIATLEIFNVGFFAFLFFAPLFWGILLGVYLFSAFFSAILLWKNPSQSLFYFWNKTGAITTDEVSTPVRLFSFQQVFLATGLAFYPLIYIFSLVFSITELQNFSIHLPSEVYTHGLLWMLYSSPGIFALAWVAWKWGIKPSLRSLVYYYAALIVMLFWILIWEKLDAACLQRIYSLEREPLYFGIKFETYFRLTIKIFFYGWAFLLGSGYLVKAITTKIFFKRALFIGAPSLLLYINMLFVMGDWNYYLIGLKEKAFSSQHYNQFRFLVNAQVERLPRSYRMPEALVTWSELEYQMKNVSSAKKILEKLLNETTAKPYYARLLKIAKQSLENLEDEEIFPSSKLNFTSIKPAPYLDRDWYGLLSAVAFLQPKWTDSDLKKRLLELSATVQIHLPKLKNIPDIVPILQQLEIPTTVCFLSLERINSALHQGYIPYVNLYGHWVPISGYDSGRRGYYFYIHNVETKLNWFTNNDFELIVPPILKSTKKIAGQTTKPLETFESADFSLQNFIPESELNNHILDIGGVGLILGDSNFVSLDEKKSAYLVELGDAYYQEHENYPLAAEKYQLALSAFNNDQVLSRILYLKRRYTQFASDPTDLETLFTIYPPEWFKLLELPPQKEKEIVKKMMNGELGTYLMMNWVSKSDSASQDTALTLFSFLHQKDSHEPIYLDSLANLNFRLGNLALSEKYYSELSNLYPFGNEFVSFQLAWIKFKLGKIEEIPSRLSECKGFSEAAKYLTLKGAFALHQGHNHSAYANLSRSLKMDKSLGETHELLAKYYLARRDTAAAQVHQLWQRRSL